MKNMAVLALFIVAIALVLASYAIRMAIYRSLRDNRAISGYLKDTSVFIVGDFLFIRLFRIRKQLVGRERALIEAFFYSSVLAAAAITALCVIFI